MTIYPREHALLKSYLRQNRLVAWCFEADDATFTRLLAEVTAQHPDESSEERFCRAALRYRVLHHDGFPVFRYLMAALAILLVLGLFLR